MTFAWPPLESFSGVKCGVGRVKKSPEGPSAGAPEFGSRTFPLPDNSPTDQIAQADKSPTGNYPVKR